MPQISAGDLYSLLYSYTGLFNTIFEIKFEKMVAPILEAINGASFFCNISKNKFMYLLRKIKCIKTIQAMSPTIFPSIYVCFIGFSRYLFQIVSCGDA